MSSEKEPGPIRRLLQALCPCGTTLEEEEDKIEITVENTAGELLASARYKRTKFNRILFRIPIVADKEHLYRKTNEQNVFRPGYQDMLKYQVDQPIADMIRIEETCGPTRNLQKPPKWENSDPESDDCCPCELL
ncbi:uncharacterized protein LOC115881169 [Sitophilus oryzae]|uniref:Uncharacterized protein LOC115881169 n=1 Tax=Sitophilus oryzae TaxID=7048 RepID=A0A6J2XTQ7_SITOR|nr:uncharacterized protein LOC115881169 [Sitophilus oryzae]